MVLILFLLRSAVRNSRRIVGAVVIWCIHVGDILLVMALRIRIMTLGVIVIGVRVSIVAIMDLSVGVCVGARG